MSIVGDGNTNYVRFFLVCQDGGGSATITANGLVDFDVQVTSGSFAVQSSQPTLDVDGIGGALLAGNPSGAAFLLTISNAPASQISLMFGLIAEGSECTFSSSSNQWQATKSIYMGGTGSVTTSKFFVNCSFASSGVTVSASGSLGVELLASSNKFSVQAKHPTLNRKFIGGALLVNHPGQNEFVIAVETAPAAGVGLVFDLFSVGASCSFSAAAESWAEVLQIVLMGTGKLFQSQAEQRPAGYRSDEPIALYLC